jgi:CYTH domain-containing protein
VPKFFSKDDIPVAHETVKLTQYYLKETAFRKDMAIPANAEKVIERVRVRESYGERTFIYTVKAFVPGEPEPYELEDFVSQREFVELVTYANGKTIRKDRTYFIWENQYFEFDQFEDAIDDDANNLLELEVAKKQQKFILPPFIPNLRNVTTDPQYRNEYIALNLR